MLYTDLAKTIHIPKLVLLNKHINSFNYKRNFLLASEFYTSGKSLSSLHRNSVILSSILFWNETSIKSPTHKKEKQHRK